MTRKLAWLFVAAVIAGLMLIVLQACMPITPPLPLPAASGQDAPASGVRLKVECASCGDVDLKLGPGLIDAGEAPAPEAETPGTPDEPAAEPAPKLPPYCPANTACLLTGPLFGATSAGEFNEAQCINHPDSIGCDRFQFPK